MMKREKLTSLITWIATLAVLLSALAWSAAFPAFAEEPELPTGGLAQIDIPEAIELTEEEIAADDLRAAEQGDEYGAETYALDASAAGELYYGLTPNQQIAYEKFLYAATVVPVEEWDKDHRVYFAGNSAAEAVEQHLTKDDVYLAFNALLYDHPEVFYTSGYQAFSSSDNMTSFYLKPNGIASTTDRDTKLAALNNATDTLLAGVDQTEGDARTALLVHDALAAHNTYDYAGLAAENSATDKAPYFHIHTAYDALVLGHSVCDGYAKSYEYLLNKCGIRASIVNSTALNHAWSLVWLDNGNEDDTDDLYETDVTWDDSGNAGSHKYYDLTTENMVHAHNKKSRDTTGTTALLPLATGTTYVDKFDVEYDLAGGTTPEPVTYTQVANWSATPAIEDLTHDNDATYAYDFAGWTPEIADYVTKNVTYTAQWTKRKLYTVTYDLNEGTPAGSEPLSYTIPDGDATPTIPAPTREAGANCAYEFAGWSPAVAATVTKNVTYTAQWKSIYTVTYDLNGGTPAGSEPLSYTVPDGDATPTIPAPTREAGANCAYEFAGWSPAVAATVTKSVTYTAQWKSIYTVTYDLNEGTPADSKPLSYAVPDGDATPTIPAPTREAGANCTYEFAGWSPAVAATVTKNVTYTAQWKSIYTVTYDLNGGTLADSKPLSYAVPDGDATPTIPAPEHKADANYTYEFAGWSPVISSKVTKNVTYTAQWTKRRLYTVYYNLDGGTSPDPDRYTVPDGDATPTITAPTRASDTEYAYDFAGWSPAVAAKVTNNATYTAEWTRRKLYTVTYNLNGGIPAGTEPQNYTIPAGDVTPTITDPTRDEDTANTYEFAGWSPEVAATVTGNATYTAQWKSLPKPTATPLPTAAPTPAPTATPTMTPAPSATPAPDDGTKGFVDRLYSVCLDRNADAGGEADWTDKLTSYQISGTQAAYGFVFSTEFQNKNYSNDDYVEYLYSAFMGRKSDAAGKADWVAQLESGRATREDVFYGFANSVEFDKICNSYGIVAKDVETFVTRLYSVCLERKPDEGGLTDWANQLRGKTISGTKAAYGFVFSKEFTEKNYSNDEYVEHLYSAFMGRKSDAAGKANWLAKLESGAATRENVFYGFADSVEFGEICARYGIDR